jgi:nucleotide-binding universal stress UspA family protein
MTTQRDRMPVVVGVDGSPAAVDAVRWAAAQALRDGLSLRLVHAYELPAGFPTGVTEEESVLVAIRERGRAWLAGAAAVAAEALPAERVETTLTSAATAAGLLRESETASLVVLGNKGRNLLTGMLAGSTSVAVAGHAHCPVVLVRGTAPAGPVVVGVDGTQASEPAIAFAFAEASARGAELVALHAWADSVFDSALAGNGAPLDFDRDRQVAEEVLAERLAGWQEKYPDVTVRRDLVHDRPNRALRRCAQTAQLLVVGRRGHGGFRDLVLGSNSQHVVHHANCPVAVLRSETSE